MKKEIETIIESVLKEATDDPLEVWMKDMIKREIPGLEVDKWNHVLLRGVKDPVANSPIEVAYVSTIGSSAIILKVPNLNIGTTKSHGDDISIKIKSEEDLSDPKIMQDVEQKLKSHFVKWSKFFSKYESLYKEKEAFKH